MPYKNHEDKPKKRICMSCGKSFTSGWIGNRICQKCRTSPKFSERGLRVFDIPTIRNPR